MSYFFYQKDSTTRSGPNSYYFFGITHVTGQIEPVLWDLLQRKISQTAEKLIVEYTFLE